METQRTNGVRPGRCNDGKRLPEDVEAGLPVAGEGIRKAACERAGPKAPPAAAELGKDANRERERLEAVEQALVAVGADIAADEVRRQLREAIMLNVKSGRKYPYELLRLEGVSRSDFYRRKDKFLEDIAARMGLL